MDVQFLKPGKKDIKEEIVLVPISLVISRISKYYILKLIYDVLARIVVDYDSIVRNDPPPLPCD